MMLALVLLGTISALFFGFVNRQGRSFHRYTVAGELNETAVFAMSEIRILISTGRFEEISPCGKRLTLSFGENRVDVYPRHRSLLVRHKGASNPIAGFVVEEKTGFESRENAHGRRAVVVTLAFEEEGKELVVRFPVVSLLGE